MCGSACTGEGRYAPARGERGTRVWEGVCTPACAVRARGSPRVRVERWARREGLLRSAGESPSGGVGGASVRGPAGARACLRCERELGRRRGTPGEDPGRGRRALDQSSCNLRLVGGSWGGVDSGGAGGGACESPGWKMSPEERLGCGRDGRAEEGDRRGNEETGILGRKEQQCCRQERGGPS